VARAEFTSIDTSASVWSITTAPPAGSVTWRDIDDDPVQSRHSYIVHAEVNAILNCVVLPLTASTIYTTQFPCPRCVQSIIQVGIKRVVFDRG